MIEFGLKENIVEGAIPIPGDPPLSGETELLIWLVIGVVLSIAAAFVVLHREGYLEEP